MTRRIFSLLLALAIILPTGAEASHYSLNVIDLCTGKQSFTLLKHDILTTKDLLSATSTKQKREALAKKTGFSMATLEDWARFCDLLQVKGIGPKMVRLLREVGIKTSDDLEKADPAEILEALPKAAKKQKLEGPLPGMVQLTDWIEQASSLPVEIDL
jgi:predicted flap endonuclease-1-like 5' DNA nuclease